MTIKKLFLFLSIIILLFIVLLLNNKNELNDKVESIELISIDNLEEIDDKEGLLTLKTTLNIKSGASLEKFKTSNNTTINYYKIVSNNPTYDMPLIVYLHGDGETYSLKSITKLPLYNFILDSYMDNSFIFIAPHRSKRDWISKSVSLNLKELIDSVVDEHHINKNKIIIMGASRGSMGVWNMISLYGDYFSAACPISWHPTTELNYNNLVKVPIYAISGNRGYPEKMVNSKMTDTVNRINELGGKAFINTYNGETHDTIAAAFPNKELLDILLDNKSLD